jgi:hypothetical protein
MTGPNAAVRQLLGGETGAESGAGRFIVIRH